MALRDQLLGLDSSVYSRLNPLGNFQWGNSFPIASDNSPGAISQFDPFTNRERSSSQVSSSPTSGLPALMSPPAISSPASIPTGATASTTSSAAPPIDSPLRGLASIPKETLAQMTRADLSDLPVNLLTGELSATPQTNMGFITVNPQGPHSDAAYNLPLNFQPPQFEQVSAGESPAWRNLTTGEVGPMPDPNFDPGLGNFTSSSRSSFLQGGGGSTFDLLPAGKFGNPDTAFMSPKGFWDWSSSPLSVFGSLLGGSLGIAGGFPGFAGLLASNESGNPLAGIATKGLLGLLG